MSCIARPAESLEVSGADGRAVCGPRPFTLDERSSRFGRGREVAMEGEPGSFFTLIIGGAPFRLLHVPNVSSSVPHEEKFRPTSTHLLGDVLPLPGRSGCCAFSPPELGEPLLRALFCAGSARSVLGGADAMLV